MSNSAVQVYDVSLHTAYVLILSVTPEEHPLIVQTRSFFASRLKYTHIETYGNLRADEARARLRARVLDAPKNLNTDLLFVVVIGHVRLPDWDTIYMLDNTRWTNSELHYDLYISTDAQERRALDLLAGKPKVVCLLAWPYSLHQTPLGNAHNENYKTAALAPTASAPPGYNVPSADTDGARRLRLVHSPSASQTLTTISHTPNPIIGQLFFF